MAIKIKYNKGFSRITAESLDLFVSSALQGPLAVIAMTLVSNLATY